MPELKYNLISVSRIRKAGASVVFKDGKATISKDGVVVAEGIEEGGLYWLTCRTKNVTANVAKVISDENELWHKRLGHLGMTNLLKLSKNGMAKGISNSLTNELSLCESCLKGKQTRLPFDGTRFRAKRPLQIVHSDICGPVNVETYDEYKYFVTFVDDYTHVTVLYLMKTKDEMFECFLKFKSMAEAHFETKLSRLRCDNGKEYASNKMKELCDREGVTIQFTTPYSPELNGVSERMNRTLVEKAKSMLVESNLPLHFWGEAVRTATYLTNRSQTNAVKNKTPYEMWHRQKPDLSKLKIFGCRAYALIPKEKRKKFDDKSFECIMLGYAENGYRLWDKTKNCLVNSRDVIFDENRFEKSETEYYRLDEEENTVVGNIPNVNEEQPEVVQTPVDDKLTVTPKLSRPTRMRRKPLRFDD